MKEAICSSPFFGITLSIAVYSLSVFIKEKSRISILNPLLLSYFIIIPILLVFDIPLEMYDRGGDIISLFLSPATAVLAISIYRQKDVVKEHMLAILIGSVSGVIASFSCVYVLVRFFCMDDAILYSLLPKSITTPMAIAVSSTLGGIEALTVISVILTGIAGAVLSPVLIKVFRIKNSIVAGMAIGSSSHAVGTSKAIEIGETEGTLSSISLVSSGVITVLISLFI